MNYHTSFHSPMQNDNGWTMSGRQVVPCSPDRPQGAVKGLRNCQKRMRLCSNLFGRRLADESATKQYFLHHCKSLLWVCQNAVEPPDVPRVHRAASDPKQQEKSKLLRKREAPLRGAAESHFTRFWRERQRRAGLLMQ